MMWTRYRLQSCISVEKNSFIFHFSTSCSFVFFVLGFYGLMVSRGQMKLGDMWVQRLVRWISLRSRLQQFVNSRAFSLQLSFFTLSVSSKADMY